MSKLWRRRAIAFSGVIALILIAFVLIRANGTVMRIREWQNGRVYVEVAAKPGDELYFGWVHSLEKIPWNEYYHIADDLTLTLDSINFPAFGAGIPENKGTTRVHDGLIYMEDIGQEFPMLKWLNSPYTKDIALNGQVIASGESLPDDKILVLLVERRGVNVTRAE